ncbi:hypothetical protein [Chryseobacterium indoltheticum]|jgi:hypothetical protein|uniref:hypothetical protein n=1 Tax=Chryseobacterium indoltheticum TaxID=254 RepID=UPI00242C26E8|nr:hypothetical protein [Chryseobacterium indoltheticum]MDF2834170.1 hypothetical protein [Chryseobacterium indoltheticum]
MKNSVLLVSLLLIVSCKKAVPSQERKTDSVIVSEQRKNTSALDSSKINESNDTLQSVHSNSDENVNTQNGEIVKLIDGERLPSTLECEFTDKVQKVVLRITNYKKDQLKATIMPENNNMNIRFNQIKTPDGKYDGPFGRDISYKISGKGEVALIIGKNLMADGDNVGRFSVRVE